MIKNAYNGLLTGEGSDPELEEMVGRAFGWTKQGDKWKPPTGKTLRKFQGAPFFRCTFDLGAAWVFARYTGVEGIVQAPVNLVGSIDATIVCRSGEVYHVAASSPARALMAAYMEYYFELDRTDPSLFDRQTGLLQREPGGSGKDLSANPGRPGG